MPPPLPILVATCGNDWAGEDGFGPVVARLLHQRLLPGVELLDLGINPTRLVDYLPGRRELIIVDAMTAAGRLPAWEVVEFDWSDPARPALISERPVSTHGLSIPQQLDLAGTLGLLPPVVRVMGLVVPGATDLGDAVSNQTIQAAREVVRRIEQRASACPRAEKPTAGSSNSSSQP